MGESTGWQQTWHAGRGVDTNRLWVAIGHEEKDQRHCWHVNQGNQYCNEPTKEAPEEGADSL